MEARSRTAAEIGHQIADQSKELKVRLPRNLADQAVAIWRRSRSEEELSPETDREMCAIKPLRFRLSV